MEYFRETFLNEKSNHLSSSTSLFAFEAAYNNKIFKQQNVSSIKSLIKNINSSLTNRSERSKSLSLLILILPQCDNNILIENGEKWFKLCSQFLKSSCKTNEKIAIIKILTFILKRSIYLKELVTKIGKVKIFLPFFYSPLLQVALIPSGLECLYEYLKLYPNDCLKHRNEIEKYVCSFLNFAASHDPKEVRSAARVYAALPLPKGCNEPQERGKQVMQLVFLSHQSLDLLFKGIPENEEYDFSSEKISIPFNTLESAKLLKEPVRLRLTSSLIVTNAFAFISEFFSFAIGAFVNVSPKQLLRLVFRVLQVEMKAVTRMVGQEKTLLSYVLPSLHMRALHLLQDLIQRGLCSNFYGLVGEQVVATLTASHQSLQLEQKSSKNAPIGELINVLSYETLVKLVQLSKGRHSLPVELGEILKKNIQISKETVTLKVLRGHDLNVSLKRRPKKGYSLCQEDLSKDVSDTDSSQSVPSAAAALRLVEALFLHSHHTTHSIIVKELRDTLLELTQTSLGGVYIYPEARVAFYRAILSYSRFPHPMFPLPYNLVHRSFLIGSRDQHHRVREICAEGLVTLSFIMANPQVSKLADLDALRSQYAVDRDDHTTADNGERVMNESVTENDEEDEICHNEELMNGPNPSDNESTTKELSLAHLEPDPFSEDNSVSSEGIDLNCEERNISESDLLNIKSHPNYDDKDNSQSDGVDGDLSEESGDSLTVDLPQNRQNKRKKDPPPESTSCKVKKTSNVSSVSLSEMLASFVDADPDDSDS